MNNIYNNTTNNYSMEGPIVIPMNDGAVFCDESGYLLKRIAIVALKPKDSSYRHTYYYSEDGNLEDVTDIEIESIVGYYGQKTKFAALRKAFQLSIKDDGDLSSTMYKIDKLLVLDFSDVPETIVINVDASHDGFNFECEYLPIDPGLRFSWDEIGGEKFNEYICRIINMVNSRTRIDHNVHVFFKKTYKEFLTDDANIIHNQQICALEHQYLSKIRKAIIDGIAKSKEEDEKSALYEQKVAEGLERMRSMFRTKFDEDPSLM